MTSEGPFTNPPSGLPVFRRLRSWLHSASPGLLTTPAPRPTRSNGLWPSSSCFQTKPRIHLTRSVAHQTRSACRCSSSGSLPPGWCRKPVGCSCCRLCLAATPPTRSAGPRPKPTSPLHPPAPLPTRSACSPDQISFPAASNRSPPDQTSTPAVSNNCPPDQISRPPDQISWPAASNSVSLFHSQPLPDQASSLFQTRSACRRTRSVLPAASNRSPPDQISLPAHHTSPFPLHTSTPPDQISLPAPSYKASLYQLSPPSAHSSSLPPLQIRRPLSRLFPPAAARAATIACSAHR